MEHRLPSDVIADRVRQERRRQGLSNRALAERCAELGAPQLTGPVLLNIEHGRRDENGRRRRTVSADEVLVLAYALGVSPLVLLFDSDGDAPYAITPELVSTTSQVFEWLVGERQQPLTAPGEDGAGYPDEARAVAWHALVQALPFREVDSSTAWPLNNALALLRQQQERAREQSEALTRIAARLRDELDPIVREQGGYE